ncbi:host cell division inhibitor Icd-like protein [Escherichia coli]|nr:host cell division inhibitor Icd-like protein [Escherichia coli]ELM7933131.1 host cell division inhibitor Icd-like protein [Escherichia coli]
MILNEPAAQKEAFNLASLLTNVNPYNLIKPKVANGCLLSIVMVNDLAKLSLNLSKPDIHALKKSLPLCANPVYGYSAPAKSGVGRGNPSKQEATQTPKASFFVSDHYAHLISGLARTKSMVALVGLRSRRPVSFCAGISTPANVTAISERGNSGGDSLKQKEAAAMLATTPTQNPQFIWIIAAVRRDMPTITAKIHHIAAETEQEARRILARDHVCFFAGRIRTGGAHA